MLKFLLFFMSFSAFAGFLPETLSVNLEQEIIKITTGKKKTIGATLDYRYPGELKFTNDQKSVFVCNPKQSWYYNPPLIKGESGTVKNGGGDALKIVNLFDSLKNGLKDNDTYKVAKLDAQKFKLDFSKDAQQKFNVKEAILNFKAEITAKDLEMKNLNFIDLTYVDDKKVKLNFKLFRSDVGFSKEHFVFKVPANTKEI